MQAKKILTWVIACSLGIGLVNAALSQNVLPQPPINTAVITDTTNKSMKVGQNATGEGIISQSTLDSLTAGAEMLVGMIGATIGMFGAMFQVFGYLPKLGVSTDWIAALFVMVSLALFWAFFQWYTGRTLKTEE